MPGLGVRGLRSLTRVSLADACNLRPPRSRGGLCGPARVSFGCGSHYRESPRGCPRASAALCCFSRTLKPRVPFVAPFVFATTNQDMKLGQQTR